MRRCCSGGLAEDAGVGDVHALSTFGGFAGRNSLRFGTGDERPHWHVPTGTSPRDDSFAWVAAGRWILKRKR